MDNTEGILYFSDFANYVLLQGCIAREKLTNAVLAQSETTHGQYFFL